MGCYLRQCFRQIWQGLLVHEALRHPDHQDKDQSGQSPRCYPCGGSHMNSACYFSNWKDAPEFRKPSTIHQKSEQQNWKTQGKDSNKLSWDIVGGVRGFEMNLCHHFTWVKSEFRWWTCLVFWLYSYNIVVNYIDCCEGAWVKSHDGDRKNALVDGIIQSRLYRIWIFWGEHSILYKASQALAPVKPTGIPDLPCEILEIVFSFLLVSEEPIDGSRLYSELHRKISGQIVLTCKPMYNIGIHYIFRNNDLMFCEPSELHNFIRHSGVAAARSILLKIGDATSCSWYQFSTKEINRSRLLGT